MGITRMKVTGRKGMGNITLSFKDGKLTTIDARGKMADMIARGMAKDLDVEKIEPSDSLEERPEGV